MQTPLGLHFWLICAKGIFTSNYCTVFVMIIIIAIIIIKRVATSTFKCTSRHPLYKAEKPFVCLSVLHTDNSPGTAHINISTAAIRLRWSDCVLQQAEDEEVEKTRATFHQKPQPYDSIGIATDLHSGGRGFESSWWTDFFFKNQYFCIQYFFKFSFDSSVTWHSKHTSKWDLSEIKCTSSGNSTMVIAKW